MTTTVVNTVVITENTTPITDVQWEIPSIPILDDFNRSNRSLYGDSNWVDKVVDYTSEPVIDNQHFTSPGAPYDEASAYWSTVFNLPIEIYVDCDQDAGNYRYAEVYACVQTPGGTKTFYRLSSSYNVSLEKTTINLRRYDNDAIILGKTKEIDGRDYSKICLRVMANGDAYGFVNFTDTGWEFVVYIKDSSPLSSGYFGMLTDTAIPLDNYGGGEYTDI